MRLARSRLDETQPYSQFGKKLSGQVGQAVACAASLTSDEKVIGSDALIFDAPGITLPFVDLVEYAAAASAANKRRR
jgi:hypothetical protein